MDALLKKKKRFPWPAVIIPSIVITIIGVFIACYSYDRSETIFYKDFKLSAYELSSIEGEPKHIENAEYSLANLYKVIYERGLVFPKAIASGEIYYFEYYERVKSSRGYDRCEIYLEWHMDEHVFDEECQRLSNIKAYKNIAYSKNLFSLPSYVAAYNFMTEFEYAIVEKDANIIRYVLLDEIGDISNIVFSTDYAPQKVLKNTDLKIYNGIFTIYQ